jgi:hypothetical protein
LSESSELVPLEAKSGSLATLSVPFVVLSAGFPDPDATLTSTQRHAMWVDEVQLQERVAALSSRGVHYAVDGSGHFIQKDRPSAVISAVDEVVDQARYGKH